MLEQTLECLADTADSCGHCTSASRRACLLSGWLAPAQARFLRQLNFTAAAHELMFLPGDDGLAGAVLGLGHDCSPAAFGSLAFNLPEGMPWCLQPRRLRPWFCHAGILPRRLSLRGLKGGQTRPRAAALACRPAAEPLGRLRNMDGA